MTWGTCGLYLRDSAELPKSFKQKCLSFVTKTDHVAASGGQIGVTKIGDRETDGDFISKQTSSRCWMKLAE